MRTYFGTRVHDGDVMVVVLDQNGARHNLTPRDSLKIRQHSPTGFEWGYGGSGPAQLALAILLDYHGTPEVAEAYYQQFKCDFVARWGDNWRLNEEDIDQWMLKQFRS